MSDNEEVTNARIASEAQDVVGARPPGGGAAVMAALKRYLASEQYRRRPRHATDERRDRPEQRS